MTVPVITVGVIAAGFVGELERLHGPIAVARRCQDLAEAVALCHSGIARAIITDMTSELSASLVDRMNTFDVAVVALSADPEQLPRLEAMGAVAALANVSVEELAPLVVGAVQELAARRAAGDPTTHGYADTAEALTRRNSAPAASVTTTAADGEIIAVWGPTGAPGRTTVALNLAAELAAEGKHTILLDADTYGASVAAALGLLDESAGLAQACRLADQGLLNEESLRRVISQLAIGGGQLEVLTGITRPDRWPELRPVALAAVLKLCKSMAAYTVIDCGFCVETDEELSFDTQAPRRNGATLASLTAADTIYAVGSADAVGVPRMVRALSDLDLVLPGAVPKILFNKMRTGSVGRSPERALQEAWDRFGPALPIHAFLPSDPVGADAAVLGGSTLLEVSPASPLRRAVAGLLEAPGEHRHRGSQPARRSKVKFSPRGVRLLARRPR